MPTEISFVRWLALRLNVPRPWLLANVVVELAFLAIHVKCKQADARIPQAEWGNAAVHPSFQTFASQHGCSVLSAAQPKNSAGSKSLELRNCHGRMTRWQLWKDWLGVGGGKDHLGHLGNELGGSPF